MSGLWRRFMALPVLTRASVVVGIVAVVMLIAVLRPRPPEPPSRALAAPTDLPPTVQPLPSASAPPAGLDKRGGLAFSTKHDRAAMLAKLNAAGPLTWTEREGEFRGEYLFASVPPAAAVRIFALDGGRWLADMKAPPDDYDRVQTLVVAKILPVVEASDIKPAPSFD